MGMGFLGSGKLMNLSLEPTDMKVECFPKQSTARHYGVRPIGVDGDSIQVSAKISRTLPYFWKGAGHYVHRVRSGTIHFTDWDCRNRTPMELKMTHISFNFWCDGVGFAGTRNREGKLYSAAPETGVVCATCEGRAIGAGQTDSRMICGHMVKFAPRI